MKDWICQIRPGNPYQGRRLRPEDFFRPVAASQIVFEEGITAEVFALHSQTVILKNREFCAVEDYVYSKPYKAGPTHKTSRPSAIHICLPRNVRGREVLFYSPTIDPLTIK